MSVIIKGFKIPKNCFECKIKAWEEGYNVYSCPFCGILDLYWLSRGRKDGCPLVELPENHGRLIDGDELLTAFPVCDSNMNVKTASVRATINHMQTVIEEEG